MKRKNVTYIAIVDDKKVLRNALAEKLQNHSDLKVLFTAENGKDFLEQMMQAHRSVSPDLVLMDIDMPVMNGIDAVREGKIRYPDSKYMMLTVFDEDDKIFNAIRAGANGYLLKDEPIDKIREAIFSLLTENDAPMSPSIARRTLQLLSNLQLEVIQQTGQAVDYNLSDREKDVLQGLIDGHEYKEIALKLEVSPNTVRNHITNIYKKLHVTSKAQAIRLFLGR